MDFGDLQETTLKLFQMDYKFGNKAFFNFEVPIANEKHLKFDINDYCSIKDISQFIAKTNADVQQRSRRSTIDINDLKQLSDEEDETNDLDRVLPSFERLNRSEMGRENYFDQPIASYNDDMEVRSLRFSVNNASQDVSFTIGGDINWKCNNSII